MKVVLIQEVQRSGKEEDKSVPMHLALCDAENRPSKVGVVRSQGL